MLFIATTQEEAGHVRVAVVADCFLAPPWIPMQNGLIVVCAAPYPAWLWLIVVCLFTPMLQQQKAVGHFGHVQSVKSEEDMIFSIFI